MIYGDLRLRDRLVRAALGAVLGIGAGAFVGWGMDMRAGLHRQYSLLLPATLIGGVIGAVLAFRLKRIV
jgi:hypothetical protein